MSWGGPDVAAIELPMVTVATAVVTAVGLSLLGAALYSYLTDSCSARAAVDDADTVAAEADALYHAKTGQRQVEVTVPDCANHVAFGATPSPDGSPACAESSYHVDVQDASPRTGTIDGRFVGECPAGDCGQPAVLYPGDHTLTLAFEDGGQACDAWIDIEGASPP